MNESIESWCLVVRCWAEEERGGDSLQGQVLAPLRLPRRLCPETEEGPRTCQQVHRNGSVGTLHVPLKYKKVHLFLVAILCSGTARIPNLRLPWFWPGTHSDKISKLNFVQSLVSSVPDPLHFDTDPDPRIRTSDKRIRIWILLFRQWPSRRQQK